MSLKLKSLNSGYENSNFDLSLKDTEIWDELSVLKNIVTNWTNSNKLEDSSKFVKSMVIIDDSSKLI